jgi:hypothetical protein
MVEADRAGAVHRGGGKYASGRGHAAGARAFGAEGVAERLEEVGRRVDGDAPREGLVVRVDVADDGADAGGGEGVADGVGVRGGRGGVAPEETTRAAIDALRVLLLALGDTA